MLLSVDSLARLEMKMVWSDVILHRENTGILVPGSQTSYHSPLLSENYEWETPGFVDMLLLVLFYPNDKTFSFFSHDLWLPMILVLFWRGQ